MNTWPTADRSMEAMLHRYIDRLGWLTVALLGIRYLIFR